MSDARQVVPMHFDHSNNEDELKPVAMDLFEKKERGAANAVGKMTSFEVSPDGQSAEVGFVTLTPSATEKFDANAIQVSPVLFPSWKDGAGNEYSDVITHLDAVVHPVDHSQGPAERVAEKPVLCAIRMGLSPKPLQMALSMDDDKDKPDSKVSSDSKEGDNGPEGETTDSGSTASVGEILKLLTQIDIVLPDDTNGSNFLDRIHAALLTAIAIGDDGMADEQKPSEDTKVVDPQIATMSLQARQALAFGEKQHRSAVMGELNELLQTGRCTPAEHDKQKQLVGVMKLSLTEAGDPEQSGVEKWIESRRDVPAGTFWDDSQKLQKLSIASHPNPVTFGKEGEAVNYDEAADFVLGKTK